MLDEKLILLSKPQTPSSLDVEHRWNTYGTYTISDGLLSNVDDIGTLADSDMVQPTAANMSQFGYDEIFSIYARSSDLTLSGTDADSWTNNLIETSTRKLPNLTGSGGTRPNFNLVNETVDFASGDLLVSTATRTDTVYAFTDDIYIKIQSDLVQSASTQEFFYRYGLASGTHLWLGLTSPSNSLNVTVIASIIVSGVPKSVSITYTYAEINSILSSGLVVTARYKQGNFEVFINGVSIGVNNTVANAHLIAQRVAISNSFSTTIGVKRLKIYQSVLTNNEVLLNYTNRDNFSYALERNYSVSTTNSFLSSSLIANTTVTRFTASTWIYLQNITAYTDINNADQIVVCNKDFNGSGTKGFHLKIQKNVAGNVYFRFIVGDGISVQAVNSPQMTLADFRNLYQDKYVMLSCTLYNQGAIDSMTIYVNGYVAGNVSVMAGSFITSVDGIVALGQGLTMSSNFLAGNKIVDSFINFNRAYSATEMRRRYLADITEHPEYSN